MGAFLTCPHCKSDTHVGHFEWESIVCLNCKKEVNQRDWLISIQRAAQLRLHWTVATPRKIVKKSKTESVGASHRQ